MINWIPVLVAYSGNEQSVYTAWTNQTECNDLTTPLDISVTTRHLRNPLIDRWTDVGVKKVSLYLLTSIYVEYLSISSNKQFCISFLYAVFHCKITDQSICIMRTL